jgi:hypothetical protein
MALSDSDVTEILEALESHFAGKLNQWEAEFVESVSDQWDDGNGRLSDRQRAKLEEIWNGFRTGRRT